MLRPVKPGQVKNALLNALDRHGIPHDTAQSIWDDLTTGNDPRPAGIPAQFRYKGIKVAWPSGRHTRVLREDERKALNAALKHSTKGNRENLLDSEDSAEVARHAYTCLYNLTTQPDYDSTPIAVTAMAALVKEATATSTVEHAVPQDAFSRDLAGNVEPWARVIVAPTKSQKITVEHVAVEHAVLDDLTAQLDALTAQVNAR